MHSPPPHPRTPFFKLEYLEFNIKAHGYPHTLQNGITGCLRSSTTYKNVNIAMCSVDGIGAHLHHWKFQTDRRIHSLPLIRDGGAWSLNLRVKHCLGGRPHEESSGTYSYYYSRDDGLLIENYYVLLWHLGGRVYEWNGI